MTAPLRPDPTAPIRAQADATTAQRVLSQPSPMDAILAQVGGTLSQIVRDPFGTIIGAIKQPFKDLHTALFSITPEELRNPLIQARLRALGVDPEKLAPTADANQVLLASGRTAALVAGTAAGIGVGAALGRATTTLAAAGHGAAEALAFGTVGGALTPIEEGQTRAGNVITWQLLGLPLGTVGGVVSHAIATHLRRQSITPELDAPEVAPTPREFDPAKAAREAAEIPTFMRRGQAVVDEMFTDVGTTFGVSPLGRPTQRTTSVTVPTGNLVLRPSNRFVGPPRQPPPARPKPSAAPAPQDPVQATLAQISIGEKAKTRPLTVDGLYTALVDDLHPVNQATKALLRLQREQGSATAGTALVKAGEVTPRKPSLTPGLRLAALDDPYVLARLSRGSPGVATHFLERGTVDWKTLAVVDEPLRTILDPIVRAGATDNLRAMLVAPRVLEAAARGIKTPITPEIAAKVIALTPPEVQVAALKTFRYNDQVLQYLIDSGALTEQAGAAFRKANQMYVPFYRFISEERPGQPLGGPSAGTKMGSVATGIQKLKGGQGPKLIDPLEGIIRNTYGYVSLANRYAVGDALVRLAESVPEQGLIRRLDAPPKAATSQATAVALRTALEDAGVDIFPEPVMEEIAAALSPATEGPRGNVFWVNREGQRVYYEVEPELYRSLLDLDRQSQNLVFKILEAPVSLQKAGFTTFSPTFLVRNPFRDQFTAGVLSRYGFTPGVDLVRGIFHALGKDELFHAFERSGGQFATLVRSTAKERTAAQLVLSDLLRGQETPVHALWRGIKSPKGWLEGLRTLSGLLEESTRSQEFARALGTTGDVRLGGFAAREATLDFSRMGHLMRELNRVIPFLNPAIQDLDKLARTFGAEGGARATGAATRAIATITIPTLTLYLLNRGDSSYQELSQARKDLFWNIPLWRMNDAEGGMERSGGFFSVPKPFVLGMLFGTTVERTLDYIDQNDPEALNELATSLLGASAPPVLPGALTPLLEVATGHDFFRDGPVIPEREQRLIAQEQAGPLQGETVRLLASAFQKAGLDVAPRNVEHIISGYTGGIGASVLGVTDAALRFVGVRRPGPQPQGMQQVPIARDFLNAFLVKEPTVNSKSVERFYRKWEEVSAYMATFREMARSGRAEDATTLMSEFIPEVAAYDLFAKTEAAIGELRRAINAVRSDTTRAAEERELNTLTLGRTIRTLAANALSGYTQLQAQLEHQRQPRPTPQRPGVTLEALEDVLKPAVAPRQ